jgi:UDP-glucose 4-epimerase
MDVFGLYTEVLIRWLERLQNGESPIIFGTGDQTMDFVYVEDVARAYLLAAESDASDEVFNVGSGIETSLRVLCQLLCREAGHPEIQPIFEPPRKINPVTRRQASIDKSKVGIGFEAAVALPEGLRELVSWYNTVSHQ